MATPTPTPGAPAGRGWLRAAGLLLAAAALAGGAGYGAWYAARTAQQEQAAAVLAQVRTLAQQQEALTARLAKVEQAAEQARVLVGGTGLADKLAELDRLKAEVERDRQAAAERAANLEKTLREQIGAQGQQTAAAVAADLKLRALIFRAHGQVLKAKVDLAEGNRGLAKEEVALAIQSLREVAAQAPERLRPELEAAAALAEQARQALVLEASTARDQLNLLWQKLSTLVGS